MHLPSLSIRSRSTWSRENAFCLVLRLKNYGSIRCCIMLKSCFQRYKSTAKCSDIKQGSFYSACSEACLSSSAVQKQVMFALQNLD